MVTTARSGLRAVLTLAGPFLLIAVPALFGCSRTPEKQVVADPRVEVRALFDTYVEALNRSDSTGVLGAYAPDSQATLAGRERFFRGPGVLNRTAGEAPLALGQNTYSIDTLEVFPIENAHALALIVYTVEPADQDIPAFHTTATYLLKRSGTRWQIIHAHLCPAREM